MQSGLKNMTEALRRGDVAAAVSAFRHGIRWRLRRAKRRLMPQTRAVARPSPSPQKNPTNLRMKSGASVAAANETLRMLGASTPEIRHEVRGAELSVGVIVPTYNDTEFLGDALRSLQGQTYQNWVCYVVDDASGQDVSGVLAEFRDDARIRLLRHGANAGLAAARNTGVRASEEDALQFLDADDMLTPWALEVRVDELRRHWHNPLVGGVHGQILQCTEETELDDLATWTTRPSLGARDWLAADGESPFTVHAPLVRTKLVKDLGGFDESFVNGAEDWDFWQRVLRHGFTFPAVQSVVGAYRQRRASMIREHSGVHLGRANALFAASDQWVEVDLDIAVSNARMPLGEGKIALKRLIRAARWAGIRAAQTGTIDGAVDGEILSFLDPGATVGTRRDECYRAAKGGIIRGLGLSTHVVKHLDRDTAQVIDSVAWKVADQLLDHCRENAVVRSGDLVLNRRRAVDVLLLAENRAEVEVLIPLAQKLRAGERSAQFVDLGYVNGESGARQLLEDCGEELIPFNSVAFGLVSTRCLVALSPIAPGTSEIVDLFQTWGAEVLFLREDEPSLVVDDLSNLLTSEEDLDFEEILEAVEVMEREFPETKDVANLRVTYPLLLPHEEASLDAASHEWLMDVKGSREGETVIVIGNGPSLNEIDFGLFEQADTFGVNSIFLASERLTRPLTYYVVEDTAVFKENTGAIKSYEADTKLFPTIYRRYFDDHEIGENTHFFRMNLGFYGRTAPSGPTGTLCLPRFSTNAAQRVFCGQSVTIINLQLAYWLGYSRVLMVGMDFSYQIPSDAEVDGNLIVSRSDDPNHFHPDYFGAGKTWKDPKLDRVLVNYRLAHRIYRSSGRQIVNCTVGGNLHEFPRMSLAEALSRPY